MHTYYYVNTGHRIGLDRFRRASAIIKSLQGHDITLLTNDFRIASICKTYGFQKGVGLDVIRNIPNIAVRGDQLIFDSNEQSPIILKDMEAFFSKMIRFSDDPKESDPMIITSGIETIAVDPFFEEPSKKEGVVLFFGDDDYEEDLLKMVQTSELKSVDLLMGFYYFFDYEEKLSPYVKSTIDEEEYAQTIRNCELLITSSYQAALEASVSGSKVVYIQRADYDPHYQELLSALGILCLDSQKITQEDIQKWLKTLKVPKIQNSVTKLSNFIQNTLF